MTQRGESLSEIDCAYLAGFFDADGAIMAAVKSIPKKIWFSSTSCDQDYPKRSGTFR